MHDSPENFSRRLPPVCWFRGSLTAEKTGRIRKRAECGSEFCAGLRRANLMPSPGGGMAYAGDLKSSDLKRSCGFDSRPGHQVF